MKKRTKEQICKGRNERRKKRAREEMNEGRKKVREKNVRNDGGNEEMNESNSLRLAEDASAIWKENPQNSS